MQTATVFFCLLCAAILMSVLCLGLFLFNQPNVDEAFFCSVLLWVVTVVTMVLKNQSTFA